MFQIANENELSNIYVVNSKIIKLKEHLQSVTEKNVISVEVKT